MRAGDTGIDKKITVGIVQKTIGLKGEIKVRPLSDNPERYEPGGRLWFDGVEGGFVIATVREQKDSLVITLEGVGTIEEAGRFLDKEVYVPESEVPPLPEGEYYHYQVIGTEVYTHGGKILGKVTDIMTAGEKDVYEVTGRGGRQYMIPVTDDAVDVMDIKGGRITLFPLEGYIDEDEV